MEFNKKQTQLLHELKESFFIFIANNLPRMNTFDRVRYVFLRLAGMNILGPIEVRSPIEIRPIGAAQQITIGTGTLINSGVRFACPNVTIKIGSRVLIGPRVCFETVNHGLSLETRWEITTKPITIEDNVWIGAGVIILQGVHIKCGAVIAAGAVVNKDVEAFTMVGGIPARVLKKID